MSDASASNDWRPAAYGEACAHCVRAKCKCFIRSGGAECARCHRLNKACERAASTRKRKPENKMVSSKRKHLSASSRPENGAPSVEDERALATPDLTPTSMDTPPVPHGRQNALENNAVRIPRIVMDTENSTITLERQETHQSTLPSPILEDISRHQIAPSKAAEQLDIFRTAFLPVFPCILIPDTMTCEELRASRPFLWLVIMALTERVVARQFAIVDTMWKIISHRVVMQHYVDMEVLLGSICFSAWSHYFKEDKPFMDMLTHLAVSMAFDLNLHLDKVPKRSTQESLHGLTMIQLPQQQHTRTFEERRTIIALYHLSQATWRAYRKTEPMKWTAYMDRCLAILDGDGTDMDRLLTAQVRCQLISSQVDLAAGDELVGQQRAIPSVITAAALLRELNLLQGRLPAPFQEDGTIKLRIWAAELAVHEHVANQSRTQCPSSLGIMQRLKYLENVLETAVRWLELLMKMPVQWWVGMTTDLFAQFMHSLIVLLKLSTLDEAGWDTTEVRRQADVLVILDRVCETIDNSSAILGIDDRVAQPKALCFKTSHLLRSLRTLFAAEMPPVTATTAHMSVATDASVDTLLADLPGEVSEDLWMGLMDEPWFADMFGDAGMLGVVDS